MNWLELLIVALAVSRVARLLVHDTITEGLREWVWRRYPVDDTQFGDSEVTVNGKDTFNRQLGHLATGVEVIRLQDAWYAINPRFIGKLISCHWCAGIWVAIAGWAGYWFYPDLVVLLAPLALAEVIGLLNDR